MSLSLLLSLMQLTLGYGFSNHLSLGAHHSRMTFRPRSPSPRLGITRVWAKKKKKSKTFDSNELKQRIDELTNPYRKLFAEDWVLEERPEHVHIIFFKPDTDEQGLHTIEYPKGSGSNFLLAFESKKACDRFAATLKAQNFGHPSPKRYDMETVESFCDMLGVFIQVVPEGKEILPPTENVESMGKHNPNLKNEKSHLNYIFDMFELEVDELGLLAMEAGSWE